MVAAFFSSSSQFQRTITQKHYSFFMEQQQSWISVNFQAIFQLETSEHLFVALDWIQNDVKYHWNFNTIYLSR